MIKIVDEGFGPYAEISFNKDGSIETSDEIIDFHLKNKHIKGWIINQKTEISVRKMTDNFGNYLIWYSDISNESKLLGKPVLEEYPKNKYITDKEFAILNLLEEAKKCYWEIVKAEIYSVEVIEFL